MVVKSKEPAPCCSEQQNVGYPTPKSPVTSPEIIIYIDPTLCIGCGLCTEVCPFGLPKPTENNKFSIRDVHLCTECSACKRNCPVGAIFMQEQEGCGCLWDVRRRRKEGACCP